MGGLCRNGGGLGGDWRVTGERGKDCSGKGW